MPKGIERTGPIGLRRVGATATERVQTARRWASKLLQGRDELPPFHGGEPAELSRLS